MKDRNQMLLWLLALVKFVLTFLLSHPTFELHRDEFLYLAEGRHLAWGYMEAPPLLSVLAWISQLTGSTHVFWVRLWPALFGALTFLVSGKMALQLGGKGLALLLLFSGFVFSAFLRLHFLFQPNFLDVFFWTLCCYWLFRFIRKGSNAYLYLLGISLGLGFLGKHSILILLAAALPALLFSSQRHVFRNVHFYLAGGVSLLIALPHLVWQYLHRFPALHHMGELRDKQLQYVEPLAFLADQLLMTLPVVVVWIAGAWYFFFHQEGRKYRVFGLIFLLVIALLIILNGKGYYALGCYPVLLAAGAYYLEKCGHRFPWLKYGLPSIILLAGLGLVPVLLPVWNPARLAAWYRTTGMDKTGILEWEDHQLHALPQDFADMLGWREISRKALSAVEKATLSGVATSRATAGPAREGTIIFASNYGLAGAIEYYGRHDPGDCELDHHNALQHEFPGHESTTHDQACRKGFPPVFSASASYLFWVPRFHKIRHIIWIGEDPPQGFDALFREVVFVDSIASPYAREKGTTIRWYREALPEATSVINAEIRRLQSRFHRSFKVFPRP